MREEERPNGGEGESKERRIRRRKDKTVKEGQARREARQGGTS